MKKFLITLALCISITTASVSAANFGVCTHMGLGNTYDNLSNIQSARDVNVEWIRDEARWQNMQSSPNGELKIRDKDMDYIKRADAAGLKQLLILAYGNESYDGVGAVPKTTDEGYWKGWLNYVTYTVTQVRDYVDAYEIWNEPNIEGFNYELQADGEDYAKLYLASKKIINELDPTATVVCGAIAGYGEDDINYGKQIFDHIKTQGNINELVDAFSIHIYSKLDDEHYATGLNTWESFFDSYGYTGEVWMTENGVYSDGASGRTESAQAAMVAKFGIQWEKYLKDNNRTGVNFWYDLRNDVGISTKEDSFGLVDKLHVMKPSGYAMKTWNNVTGNKTLDSVTSVKTKNNIISSDEYGYVAKYTNDIETAYIAYDSNGNGKTTEVALSGDIAYVYDCLGNVTETITNPSGTKTITLASSPVIVECVTYGAVLTSVKHDADNGVVSVSGTYNNGDTVTVEILENDTVKDSVIVGIEDGSFNALVSLQDAGTYTVRVGYPELTALGKSSGWAEQSVTVKEEKAPAFAASTTVAYNATSRTVSVSGALTDYVENQYVTVLALPASMDAADVDMNAVGYIKQIPATNGEFSISFELPEYYTTKTAIYLGGTGINTKSTNYAEIAENPYVYVSSFEIGKEDKLSATAIVRNYAETERKASIVIAQYGSEGSLETVKTEEKTIPAKTYAAVECSLKDVVINDNTSYAKAFIWSDMTGFVPLANFDEISVK